MKTKLKKTSKRKMTPLFNQGTFPPDPKPEPSYTGNSVGIPPPGNYGASLRVGALAPLCGVLTRAGTFTIRDEETTGLVIAMTPDEIKAIVHLPMHERVVVQPASLVEDWTVRASDYDRLASPVPAQPGRFIRL